MCGAAVDGDILAFEGPELETLMMYLAARNVAEEVRLSEGRLLVRPALPDLAEAAREICSTDVSSLLLDIKEALLHMGWVVEGWRDVVAIRRSIRRGPTGFLSFEYSRPSREARALTSLACLAQALDAMGFRLERHGRLLEARARLPTAVHALEAYERLASTPC